MKKIFAMFAAFACAAVLSACNDQKAESKTQADESLNKVKAAGEFVLGLDDSFPPMGFRDKDNNIVGFDIDRSLCAPGREAQDAADFLGREGTGTEHRQD